MTKIEVGVIVAIVLVLIVSAIGYTKNHERFMADCLQDHKQYECDMMWKAANPPPQVVHVINH